MAAARFRSPKKHRPSQDRLGRPLTKELRRRAGREVLPQLGKNGVAMSLGLYGRVHAAEPMTAPVLRRSRKGLVNVRQPQQAAIRRDLRRKKESRP